MKKVEEKFGNKAHYNSEREPIHFTALPFGFFRVSLSLSSFLFGFILLISLLFLLLCTFVCPTDWVRQSKRRILISLFYLFPRHVPTTIPPPSIFSITPFFWRFPLKFRIKRVLKQRRLLIVNFFFGTFSKPNTPCHISVASAPAPFSLFSLFAAHSLPSHSELINNFFLSSFSVSLPLVGTLKLATNLRVIAAFYIFYDFCSASSRFVLMNHGYVGYNLVLIAFCWHLCCQRHAILLMSKWGPIYDIIIERYHCV